MGVERSRSIVVQALLTAPHESWLDRWLGAIFDALTCAENEGAIHSWRVQTGGVAAVESLSAAALTRLEEGARRVGGEFTHIELGTALAPTEAHARLLDDAKEELLLIVDSDAIILGSTIARLIESLGPDETAVDARQLPVDGFDSLDSEKYFAARFCVLHSLRIVREQGLIATQSRRDMTMKSTQSQQLDRAMALSPQAVVFRDDRAVRQQEVAQISDFSDVVGGSSLLEKVFASAEWEHVRTIVSKTLSEPGEALLSVVMRTQMRRPEALRDALLCLAGQSDGRFELLLVVHDSDEEKAANILADQPQWLKSRTQILSASGGTRSRPLNVGIAAATGTLITFLDDDDLIFAHWVESFLTGASLYPRRLVRAIAGTQHAGATLWAGGVNGHTSESLVTTPYPALFDLVEHLQVNRTPFMAFAFPRRFFGLFGGADESLEVCEDWDLALRAARLLGVGDVPVLTSIYRRWSSGQDSYSVHDQNVWKRDMNSVRGKLNSLPLILPPGSADEMVEFASLREAKTELLAMQSSSSWRLTAPLRRAKGLGRILHQKMSRRRSDPIK